MMFRVAYLVNYKHIVSMTVPFLPSIGSKFSFKDIHGIIKERHLTVFDYMDPEELEGYPYYNVVVELAQKENKSVKGNSIL